MLVHGWSSRCRCLAKDFEALTRTHLAFVQLAMIRVMIRLIARPSPSPELAGRALKSGCLSDQMMLRSFDRYTDGRGVTAGVAPWVPGRQSWSSRFRLALR